MTTMSDKLCLSQDGQQHLDKESNRIENGSSLSSYCPSLFSENAMHKMIQKMLSRGYFHSSGDCGDDEEHNNKVHDVYRNIGKNNDDTAAINATVDDTEKDDIEEMKQHQKEWNNRPTYSSEDDTCQIIITSSAPSNDTINNVILTKQKLVEELTQHLNTQKGEEGRISLSNAAAKFQVTTQDIANAVSKSKKLYMIGTHDIVSESYIQYKLKEVVFVTLPLVGGRILLSDILSDVFHVPIHLLHDETSSGSGSITSFRRVVEDQINNIVLSESGEEKEDGEFIRWIMGKREIITRDYIHCFQKEVKGIMRGLTIPTPLEALAHEYNWDPFLLVEQVQSMCCNGTIPGELHGSGSGGRTTTGFSSTCSSTLRESSSSSSTSAMYIPKVYISMQQKCVHDYFTTNGYITLKNCRSMGISDGRMGDYLLELFPEAKCLRSAVINLDMIVSPLEVAVQEALSCKSFVDLKMHTPEVLLEDNDNISTILYDCVLPNLIDQKSATKIGRKGKDAPSINGVGVIDNGEALYFSPGMVQSIRDSVLPQLIESYAKARAEEIDHSMSEASKHKKSMANAAGEDDEPAVGSKGGKSKRAGGGKKQSAKGRKQSQKAAASALYTTGELCSPVRCASGVVPLCQVAKRIADKFPDLFDIQDAHGGLVDDSNKERLPSWEVDDNAASGGEGDIGYGGDGPLYMFCRQALYTQKFQDACDKAVQAELDKITSVKQGLVSSHKDGATRVRNIEAAFEDPSCFAAACQQVQMFAKSVQMLSSSSDSSDIGARLEHDFLRGCAANFAKRVTEYCIFKNDIDSGVFTFDLVEGSSATEKKENKSHIPSFCLPVEVASRSFSSVYLSCTPDDNGKERDPLTVLRQEFSGNVGVALARMWILCGGDNYFGGRRTIENGNDFIRPGNVEGFLRHVEESCLSMCGLPFKMLDKKGEKQVMFARKKGLKQALEQALGGKDVMELSILLILQQVKHIAIINGDFTDDTLELLANEKKIPREVIDKIKELRDRLQNKQDVSEDLIASVRLCGLSKDISRHIVE